MVQDTGKYPSNLLVLLHHLLNFNETDLLLDHSDLYYHLHIPRAEKNRSLSF